MVNVTAAKPEYFHKIGCPDKKCLDAAFFPEYLDQIHVNRVIPSVYTDPWKEEIYLQQNPHTNICFSLSHPFFHSTFLQYSMIRVFTS